MSFSTTSFFQLTSTKLPAPNAWQEWDLLLGPVVLPTNRRQHAPYLVGDRFITSLHASDCKLLGTKRQPTPGQLSLSCPSTPHLHSPTDIHSNIHSTSLTTLAALGKTRRSKNNADVQISPVGNQKNKDKYAFHTHELIHKVDPNL